MPASRELRRVGNGRRCRHPGVATSWLVGRGWRASNPMGACHPLLRAGGLELLWQLVRTVLLHTHDSDGRSRACGLRAVETAPEPARRNIMAAAPRKAVFQSAARRLTEPLLSARPTQRTAAAMLRARTPHGTHGDDELNSSYGP